MLLNHIVIILIKKNTRETKKNIGFLKFHKYLLNVYDMTGILGVCDYLVNKTNKISPLEYLPKKLL